MNEQRLVDIETKIAHQEVLVIELNQVIAQQQETIDQMQAALKKFFKQFRERNLGTDIGPADQKPPHY
jgi:SlyX protein